MGFILWAPAFRVLVVEVHTSQKKKKICQKQRLRKESESQTLGGWAFMSPNLTSLTDRPKKLRFWIERQRAPVCYCTIWECSRYQSILGLRTFFHNVFILGNNIHSLLCLPFSSFASFAELSQISFLSIDGTHFWIFCW